MTPEEILDRLRELQDKYGCLTRHNGKQLVVDGKALDVHFPEFLTDGDRIYVFPCALGGPCEAVVPLDAEFRSRSKCDD